MSRTLSPSTGRPYGVRMVCEEWHVARSTVYAARARELKMVVPLKRGPLSSHTDAQLTKLIMDDLVVSPFVGEGHRKVWARLRVKGIRTSKARVLRLMREANVLAPTRQIRVLGPRSHDGTIITERPDQMWGTDATSTWTTKEGHVTVFVAVDHCTARVSASTPRRSATASRLWIPSARPSASASATTAPRWLSA